MSLSDKLRRDPADIDESELEVDASAHAAAGVTAIALALRRAVSQMGGRCATRALTKSSRGT